MQTNTLINLTTLTCRLHALLSTRTDSVAHISSVPPALNALRRTGKDTGTDTGRDTLAQPQTRWHRHRHSNTDVDTDTDYLSLAQTQMSQTQTRWQR